MPPKLLIVDDEPNVISALKRAFFNEDFEIFTATSGREALEILSKNPVQVIISDEKMPGMSGAEFLTEARTLYPDTIRFMLTGHASFEAAMRAINEGEIYRFFTKPWDDMQLLFAIKAAFEKFDLEEENRRLLETVKRQAVDLKLLEKEFPSITRLRRDEKGYIMVADLSTDELADIIRQCELESLTIKDEEC